MDTTMTRVSRSEVEDFLFYEAELLDNWQLAEWEKLLEPDAWYLIPPNEAPESSHRTALFTIADDRERLHQRIIRIMDPNCHAEFPHSRTRRIIGNVRITGQDGDLVHVSANFACWRYRRHERIREYIGGYRFILRRTADGFRIKERKVILDAHELGSLGSVSFIL
jgi:p-cumate 2,3-dioxygenase beta subunit